MTVTVKQAVVLALVGMVASAVSARRCSVNFSKSPCHKFSRIDTEASFSIISNEGNSQWKSHEVDGDKITTSFANGTIVERSMSELDENERTELDEWRKIKFEEPLFALLDGQVILSSHGRNQLTGTSYQGGATLKDRSSGEEITLNLAPVASYIIQNGEIATFVDRDCKLHTMRASTIFQ